MSVIKDEELKEVMLNQGVLHEVNRTFFHPLGLTLTINCPEDDEAYLYLQGTDDVEGYVITKLDDFKIAMFRDFCNERFSAREEKLGFIIQTRDFEEVDKNYSKNKSIKTSRLSVMLKHLSNFMFEMQKKFIKHHKNYDDNNFLYCTDVAITSIERAFEERDWVSVANWAMILNHHNELRNEITSLEMKDDNNEEDGTEENHS